MVRVVKTQILDDSTGEVLATRETFGTNNGRGWVINYRSASLEIALKCTSAVTFRVFHLLISLQENYGDKGVICTRKWIQKTLNISRKSTYNAIVWLIKNRFLIETSRVGVSEFFFNPAKVTIGRDKELRLKRWRKLCADFNDNERFKDYGFDSPIFTDGVLVDEDTGEVFASVDM